ncbi:hypothetical protein ABEG18_23190 [Alsobacter sp. KACC 23698]|uniref:Uncharacterized protein n=1 Tax=Alsobacter sp. KACC 23698 TaxID=3149229 RepID=A0AAU7JEJ6_9HYPH
MVTELEPPGVQPPISPRAGEPPQERPGPSAARHVALRAGADTPLARRFHAWRGRSGRRYVVSAYEPGSAPDYAGMVALAVRRGPDGGLRVTGAVAHEAGDAPLAALAPFRDADEVHLHLLAEDECARAVAASDLGGPPQA